MRFIEDFLPRLILRGMCFAAGAVAAPPAGGAAPPAAGTGTGDTGTTGGDKGRTGGLAIPSGDGSTQVADAGAEDFGEFEDFTTDGDIDTEVQNKSTEEFGTDAYKTVKEALKANPEVFKQVKKAVSMMKRYQEHFETPEAAGQLLSDIETFGGWDSVKQEMGETATFLNGWNAGDSGVINTWLDENGEGLTKNMPTILDRWQKADPQGWAHDAAGTFMATMLQPDAKTGLSPIAALNQLGQIEGVKDSPAYQTLLQRIEGIRKMSEQAPAKVEAKQDEGKLSAREQQLQQKEQNLQRQALAGKAAPVLRSEAENALKIVAGSRKLSPQARADLLNDIHAAFARVVQKRDAEGIQKRQRLLQAGQHDQWLKMSESVAKRLMPEAARQVWRKYAGISGLSATEKATRKAEGQGRSESAAGGTTQAVVESKAPSPDGKNIDWAAMREKFGGRDGADNAFLWERKWIEKGTGKIYTKP